MADLPNVALHLLTLVFGAALWAMPKHKDQLVKMLPFFLGAWFGFMYPGAAKLPMGSDCEPVLGIELLRPNPGCFALGALGFEKDTLEERVVMAITTGTLALFLFMFGAKVLFIMALTSLLQYLNPLNNSTLGRIVSIPINLFISMMTWLFVSSIAWVLSPFTIFLYPALATLLLLHGGEYFLDTEAAPRYSNNCVTADVFSLSLNPFDWYNGKVGSFDLEKCTTTMRTVATVLYCMGVAHHMATRMDFYASGGLTTALQHTTSGKAGKVISYDGVPEPSPAKMSAVKSRTTSKSRSPSPAPRKSSKKSAPKKKASRSPSRGR